MAEEIRISPDNTHIFVYAKGKPTLREFKKTISRLVEIQSSSGIDKLLVDARDRRHHPSASHIYEGAKVLAESLKGVFRVAVLVNAIDNNHRFFEDVALNRGAILSFFQREEAACAWLFEN
jgi:hypothetical protein